MANTDRARKLLVRTALVTSTTIATLIGAQNFAALDTRDFQLTLTAPAPQENNIVVVTPDSNATPLPIVQAAPQITIRNVSPSITVLRQPGQVKTNNTVQAQPVQVQTNVTNIQPPAPSQISAPQPVIVQQPVAQRTRSSR